MFKPGKIRAGLFCGSKWYSLLSWKIEGLKLRLGPIDFVLSSKGIKRNYGRSSSFMLGIGPFIIWKDCPHENRRCVHGKEYNDSERRAIRGGGLENARVACLDCGVLIYGVRRPLVCTDSGFTHTLSRL